MAGHGQSLAALLAFAATCAAAPAAAAAPIPVNTTVDELNADGDCSLREAIIAANWDGAVDACSAGGGADMINVPTGTYTLSLGGVSNDSGLDGDLDLSGSVTIAGSGATIARRPR